MIQTKLQWNWERKYYKFFLLDLSILAFSNCLVFKIFVLKRVSVSSVLNLSLLLGVVKLLDPPPVGPHWLSKVPALSKCYPSSSFVPVTGEPLTSHTSSKEIGMTPAEVAHSSKLQDGKFYSFYITLIRRL